MRGVDAVDSDILMQVMLSSNTVVEPGADLMKAHISEDDTHAKSIASSIAL
jgi:hypothetical protein